MNRDVSVREVMDREYLAASESDGVIETAELMLREEREPAVVLRGTNPIGVLTDRDVLALLVSAGEDPGSATVGDAMTESVPTIRPDETLAAARDQMATWATRWLVVADGGDPAGVVTERDVLTSSTLGTEADATEAGSRTDDRLVAGGADAAATGSDTRGDGFDQQSICERCGALSRGLASFNGQLLCADCRDL